MARSIWNGTIAFGMVRVPIKMYSATESKRISLREVHLDDGAPVRHRRYCTAEGREVPYEEVVKGYEVGEDEYLVLTREEVKAAAGDRGKVVEVDRFVELEAIDPVYFEKTYYLGARDDDEPYAVLRQALAETGRAGIGRFTFHNREYMAAVRAHGPVLALHTMRFHDEVVDPKRVSVEPPRRKPTDKELELAEKLIGSMRAELDLSAFRDTYREAVLALVERKQQGEEISPEEEVAEPEATEDLSAALEASLA